MRSVYSSSSPQRGQSSDCGRFLGDEIEAKIRAALGISGGPQIVTKKEKAPLEVVESDPVKKKAVGQ